MKVKRRALIRRIAAKMRYEKVLKETEIREEEVDECMRWMSA